MADPDLRRGGGGVGHPDPEMRGEGRSGLRASFWSKNKVAGGPGPEGPSPGSTTEIRGSYNYVAHTLTHFGTFPTDVL